MNPIPIRFRRRDEPLEPAGVVARGPARTALVHRLLALDAGAMQSLRGLAWSDGLLVQGPADALPWVDGAEYIAPDPNAPGLWTDTRRKPWPHAEWVLAALRNANPGEGRFALLSHPRLVVPLGDVAAIDPLGLTALIAPAPHPGQ